MSSHDAAQIIADKLTAAGVDVTHDPRGATPPCVLIAPPALTFDLGCGATASWSVWALAPGPANLDAWVALDEMLSTVAGVLPVERCDFRMYSPAADASPLPAYQIQFTEGIEI
jgi:hypothetical protein